MAGIANVWLRMNLRLSAFLMRKGGIPFARAAQDKLGRLGARAVGARVEFVPHAFREFQAAWILPQGYDPEGGAILYLHGGEHRIRRWVWKRPCCGNGLPRVLCSVPSCAGTSLPRGCGGRLYRIPSSARRRPYAG